MFYLVNPNVLCFLFVDENKEIQKKNGPIPLVLSSLLFSSLIREKKHKHVK